MLETLGSILSTEEGEKGIKETSFIHKLTTRTYFNFLM
jgi:hypothetical protein